MSSSQSAMETAVIDPLQVGAADQMPPNTQFSSEKSGFDEFLESEHRDKRSVREELGNLALRIAMGEDVAASEIETIASDCDASPAKLQKMVAEAAEVLRLVALIDAERTEALELDVFQTATADENRTQWANIATLRKFLAEVLCRFHQRRCDHRSRMLKSEGIGRRAAEAARALSEIDTSIYGISVPKRTPAITKDVGHMPRNVEWIDVQTTNLINRKKAEFLELSAAGKLPPIQVIAPPESMFEPERAKPTENLEPSDEPADETAAETTAEVTPAAETPISKKTRQVGIAPGDLDDEFDDVEQPLDD